MFWELVPEDVIVSCAEVECEWKRRKKQDGKGLEKGCVVQAHKMSNLKLCAPSHDDDGQDPRVGGRRTKGGIQICHVHVDLHQKSLKKRMLSIMLCTNWVCAEHSLITSRCMELDYGFDVPCVVQWSPSWCSARTRLSEILGQDLKIN